ncbi:hypothetical protein ElyMa_006327000 [Elysia marginata]|uniref:Uncharacterized protein n=1 Tax=Elysia marginata TaxID=1093978 RepID=A0AAV4HKE9_9GAST|nr:hypothetical protein ElyMa_006327000 [Elysia marginata]
MAASISQGEASKASHAIISGGGRWSMGYKACWTSWVIIVLAAAPCPVMSSYALDSKSTSIIPKASKILLGHVHTKSTSIIPKASKLLLGHVHSKSTSIIPKASKLLLGHDHSKSTSWAYYSTETLKSYKANYVMQDFFINMEDDRDSTEENFA